ncbi:hypothetical protein CATMIT_01806, partial [Catenibacterium mitsuokai DSM 15897]
PAVGADLGELALAVVGAHLADRQAAEHQRLVLAAQHQVAVGDVDVLAVAPLPQASAAQALAELRERTVEQAQTVTGNHRRHRMPCQMRDRSIPNRSFPVLSVPGCDGLGRTETKKRAVKARFFVRDPPPAAAPPPPGRAIRAAAASATARGSRRPAPRRRRIRRPSP